MFKKISLTIFLAVCTASAYAASYQEDQAIDGAYGFLDLPWHLNYASIPSHLEEPLQMQPGCPPYDQEAERAQDRTTRPLNCVVDPQTQLLVCS